MCSRASSGMRLSGGALLYSSPMEFYHSRAGAVTFGRVLRRQQSTEPICNIRVTVHGIPAEMREAHDPLASRAKHPTFPSPMP